MIAFIMKLTGWGKKPAIALAATALLLSSFGAKLLFDNWLNGVKRDAMAAQKTADTLAFQAAQIAAERAQAKAIDQTLKRGIEIGKETANGYAQAGVAIDDAAAALGKLWEAEARTGAGGAGGRSAIALSGAAAGTDAATLCPAAGWIPMPLAIRLAAGADQEAARGDALSQFIDRNAAAWPKDKP